MLTNQRAIIYRKIDNESDEETYEILNNYDFNVPMVVSLVGT